MGTSEPNATGFTTAAAPVFDFVNEIRNNNISSQKQLLGEAAALLSRFESKMLKNGALSSTVPPARYALAVLIDDAVRQVPGVDVGSWSATSHRALFDGRDMSWGVINGFVQTAQDQGSEFLPLAEFLETVIGRAQTIRRAGRQRTRSSWAKFATLSVLGFLTAIIGYAAVLEYRYQSKLFAAFQQEVASVGLDEVSDGSALSVGLDQVHGAMQRALNAAARAPLGRYASLPVLGKEAQVRARYDKLVTDLIPPAVATALAEVLATEGDSLKLYDTLRTWAILDGRAEWSDVYVAGWVQEQPTELRIADLAPHIIGMQLDTDSHLPGPDPEILDQARTFASEVNEPARAWLELLRSDGANNLLGWVADYAVPGLSDVVVRRSGAALNKPIPGIFTAAGWNYAEKFGVGLAVQRSRDIASVLFGQSLDSQNDTPDLVMDRLQQETVAFWKTWLADLRVRPFEDAESSILISGRLALENSPLTDLLREVWAQSGGTDRTRRHENQLKVVTEFGPTIQYVERGKMADISALFAGLNVALGSMEVDEERGVERLMTLRERARSVSALQQAPNVVVQIVEDVLAQTAIAHSSVLTNPLTRRWQVNVFPLCRVVMNGRYPFSEGADANITELTELLAPGGTIDIFLRNEAQRYLDVEATPWRWRPEARLTGLAPESAVFFQKTRAISNAFFDTAQHLGRPMKLAALAERGQAFMTIGGEGAPVRASGIPERLDWPGPHPGEGIELRFKDNSADARLKEVGPWGMFRLLDGMRLRSRDDGKRFLIDMRAPQGRLFVEISFDQEANPVSGRKLLNGLTCPPVL
ncbi:MAG: ImcF-related family protein [Paracoccaceae bacterium]